MKERPILFSAPMVRAILAGTKTQTRRGVKPCKDRDLGCSLAACEIAGEVNDGDLRSSVYGEPGDRLWVKETFFAFGRWVTKFNPKKARDEWHFVDMTAECGHRYHYPEADSTVILGAKGRGGVVPMWFKRPAIFMSREASRITLEITDIRVERLQDINAADAWAEGIPHSPDVYPVHEFQALWESINGAESWGVNPWVWCVGFKRLEA